MAQQQSPATQQRNFKYQIWLMLIIVFGVIAAGFLMVPKTEQQRQRMIELFGTTNQGALVTPSVDLSPLLADLYAEEKPKWQVIIAGGTGCDASCEQILFNTRQVHMLLGKLTGRLKRIYLPETNQLQALDLETINREHPFLQVSAIDTQQLSELLENSSAAWDMQQPRYFVVTPDHQAVLYYSVDNDANGLLEDLKHLLKYSPDS